MVGAPELLFRLQEAGAQAMPALRESLGHLPAVPGGAAA
jgi:hypothetical protein